MYSREEGRKRLERDVTGFRVLRKAFQEIIDRTSRRIEEVKHVGKEIYGMDVYDPKTAGEQFHMLSGKGERKFLDWARLITEGMMLEAGREYLTKRKVELGLMLEMLEDTLARGGED